MSEIKSLDVWKKSLDVWEKSLDVWGKICESQSDRDKSGGLVRGE